MLASMLMCSSLVFPFRQLVEAALQRMSERRYTNESEPSTMLSFLVQDMGPSEPTLLVKGAPATTQRKRSVLLPTAGTPHTHTHTHSE